MKNDLRHVEPVKRNPFWPKTKFWVWKKKNLEIDS